MPGERQSEVDPGATTNPAPEDRSFLEKLLQSRLVTTDQLEEVPRPDEQTDVVNTLLQKELVTAWQVNELIAGRTSFYLDNGRYLLLEQIGRGGMGTVYRARHTRMHREVAIKIVNPGPGSNRQLIKRFRREIEICSRLQHSHLVQAYDVGQDGDVIFFVMEYVSGADLGTLVWRDGVMAPDETAAVGLQAASALAYAHAQGIVHRDIKPQNILLSSNGVTKILDLGLARVIREDQHGSGTELTHDGQLMGTVDYMAPEQASDARAADQRSDIFSLGATLYRLLSGRSPCPGGSVLEKLHFLATEGPPPLGQVRPDCPRELTDVIEGMMAKKPEDRYQTAEDVVRALQPLAAERIAGRPAVTAEVLTAAETHRDTEYAGNGATQPVFEPDVSVLSSLRGGRERRSSPPKWVWSLVPAVVVLAAVLIWRFHRRPASETSVRQSDERAAAPAPAAPVPPVAIRRQLPGHFGVRRLQHVLPTGPGKYLIGQKAWYRTPLSLVWSPDGKNVATAVGDGDVRIWNYDDGRTLTRYTGHEACITAIAWSRDARLIASSDLLGQIHVWDPWTGVRKQQLQRKPLTGSLTPDRISASLAFAPDGDRLAYTMEASGHEWTVVLWDLEQRRIIWANQAPGGIVQFSPEGNRLAAYSVAARDSAMDVWDQHTSVAERVRLWNTDTEQRLPLPETGPESHLIGFGADTTLVLWNAESREIRLWDFEAGTFGTSWTPPGEAVPFQLSHAGDRCLVRQPDGTRQILELRTGAWSSPVAASSRIIGPAADLRLCASLARHTRLEVRWTTTDELLEDFAVTTELAVDWNPVVHAGRYLETNFGDEGGWDLATGRLHERLPRQSHVTKDGRVRAISDDRILEWASMESLDESFRVVSTLQSARGFRALSWSEDGTRIIGYTRDGRWRTWSVESGKPRWTLEADPSLGQRYAVAFSGSAGTAVTYHYQAGVTAGSLRIWHEPDAAPGITIPARWGAFQGRLAISPDGERLAAFESRSGRVFIYETAKGKRTARFPDESRAAWETFPLRFSASGKFVLYANQIREATTGKKLWECPEHERSIDYNGGSGDRGMAILGDGRHVVVGQNAKFSVWNWRDNRKILTIYALPHDEWALVNHANGHWNGSPLAFEYLRLLHRTRGGNEQWLSPHRYEKHTGWTNDVSLAGIRELLPADPL